MSTSSSTPSTTGTIEIYPNLKSIAPIRIKGPVVKGFGRGSKELGIPTANLDVCCLENNLQEVPPGVYFGYCTVSNTQPTNKVYKMVMSIGWNPFYKNVQKTIEPHILHKFTEDFYGEELRLVILGYMRPEQNYPSLEALIHAIHTDISTASTLLDTEPYLPYDKDEYFTTTSTVSTEKIHTPSNDSSISISSASANSAENSNG